MKIKTLGNKIRIKIPANSAGNLNLESMTTAVEHGEVIGIGDQVDSSIEIGNIVLFKAWAVDIIDYEGEKYYFLDLSTKGLCAIVNPKMKHFRGTATISSTATIR
jgi:co-chaperonin GroES (HSP10)